MNAGILSMQRINNFGSLLQAYALKRNLESLGYDVAFMDIKRIDDDYRLLGKFALDYSLEREATGLKGKIKKIDRYILNRLHNRKLEPIQDEIFQDFRDQVLAIKKQHEKIDLCVIGSDEVFNCLNAGAWGFTSQLFGNIPEAKRIITYAASCGATTYEKLPEEVKSVIRQSFQHIEHFSVRDQNTLEFVSKLSNRKVLRNVDPVFTWDFANEMKSVMMPQVPSRYCLVYSYRNRIHDYTEIEKILAFCKNNNLRPIAVGAPQFWIKDFVVCTPFQCLKLFQNASFVITDTFHGTVFSLLFSEKFATIVRESNRNKLSDLLNLFGAIEHQLNEITDIYNLLYKPKSSAVVSQIEIERLKALEYLKG